MKFASALFIVLAILIIPVLGADVRVTGIKTVEHGIYRVIEKGEEVPAVKEKWGQVLKYRFLLTRPYIR